MNFRYHGGHCHWGTFLRPAVAAVHVEFIHRKFPYIKKELVPIMEKTAQGPEYEVEKVVLPQIASIKQASKLMGLPPYYLRRLCKEVPGLAFQSGVKWYINLGRLADYYNSLPKD